MAGILQEQKEAIANSSILQKKERWQWTVILPMKFGEHCYAVSKNSRG